MVPKTTNDHRDFTKKLTPVLPSSGWPVAHFPFWFCPLGKGRLSGGGMTGVVAEVAKGRKTERWRVCEKGLESKMEEDTTATIHSGFTQQILREIFVASERGS